MKLPVVLSTMAAQLYSCTGWFGLRRLDSHALHIPPALAAVDALPWLVCAGATGVGGGIPGSQESSIRARCITHQDGF